MHEIFARRKLQQVLLQIVRIADLSNLRYEKHQMTEAKCSTFFDEQTERLILKTLQALIERLTLVGEVITTKQYQSFHARRLKLIDFRRIVMLNETLKVLQKSRRNRVDVNRESPLSGRQHKQLWPWVHDKSPLFSRREQVERRYRLDPANCQK